MERISLERYEYCNESEMMSFANLSRRSAPIDELIGSWFPDNLHTTNRNNIWFHFQRVCCEIRIQTISIRKNATDKCVCNFVVGSLDRNAFIKNASAPSLAAQQNHSLILINMQNVYVVHLPSSCINMDNAVFHLWIPPHLCRATHVFWCECASVWAKLSTDQHSTVKAKLLTQSLHRLNNRVFSFFLFKWF